MPACMHLLTSRPPSQCRPLSARACIIAPHKFDISHSKLSRIPSSLHSWARFFSLNDIFIMFFPWLQNLQNFSIFSCISFSSLAWTPIPSLNQPLSAGACYFLGSIGTISSLFRILILIVTAFQCCPLSGRPLFTITTS